MVGLCSVSLLPLATLLNLGWISVEGFSASNAVGHGRPVVDTLSMRQAAGFFNHQQKDGSIRNQEISPLFQKRENTLDDGPSSRKNFLSRFVSQLQVVFCKYLLKGRYFSGLQHRSLWKRWSRFVLAFFFVVAFQWSMLTNGAMATTQSSMGMLGQTADLPSLSLVDPSTSVPVPKSNSIYTSHSVKSKLSRSTKIIAGSGTVLLAAVGGGYFGKAALNRRGSSGTEETEEDYAQRNAALNLRSTDSYLSSSDSANVRSGFDQIRKREQEEAEKIEEARSILRSVEETINKTSEAVAQTSGLDSKMDEDAGPAILSKLQGEEPAAAKISRRAEKERNDKARKMVEDMLARVEAAEEKAKSIKEEQSSFYKELNATKNRLDDSSDVVLPPPLEETPFISWLNATDENESDAKPSSTTNEATSVANLTTESPALEIPDTNDLSSSKDTAPISTSDDTVASPKITGMQQYLPITPPIVEPSKKSTDASSIENSTNDLALVNEGTAGSAGELKEEEIEHTVTQTEIPGVSETKLEQSDDTIPHSEDPDSSESINELTEVKSVGSSLDDMNSDQQISDKENDSLNVSETFEATETAEARDVATVESNNDSPEKAINATTAESLAVKEESEELASEVPQSKPKGFKAPPFEEEDESGSRASGSKKGSNVNSGFKGPPAIDENEIGPVREDTTSRDASATKDSFQDRTEEIESPLETSNSMNSFENAIGYKDKSDESLRKKYASISDTGERAFQILDDLGMIDRVDEGDDDNESQD